MFNQDDGEERYYTRNGYVTSVALRDDEQFRQTTRDTNPSPAKSVILYLIKLFWWHFPIKHEFSALHENVTRILIFSMSLLI